MCLGFKIIADGDCRHEIKRHEVPWKKNYDQPRQHIKKQRQKKKKQRHYFPDKGPSSQSYFLSSNHVCKSYIDVFELWCWRRLLRVSWTARRSNQYTLKEITGRTNTEAETPILWLPDEKNLLIRKDPPDVGKD